MFEKMDNYLIQKLDSCTTWAQRKGIKLTSIHVAAMGACSLGMIAAQHGDPFFTVTVGAIWGVWMFVYMRWAERNKDYPVVFRKMQSLNAEVIQYRDFQYIIRMLWVAFVFVWIAIAAGAIVKAEWVDLIISVFCGVSPVLCWYLNCCTFLGPGEFAKQKKEATQGLTQDT